MVAVGRRMNKLKALLSIRHGPGAAVLPTGITRIHMEFAEKWNEGHYGPRKFWRLCLPRLKYWNPAIPMIVNRTKDQSGPATLSIYFRQGGSSSTSTTTSTTSSSDVARTSRHHQQHQQPSSAEGQSPAPAPEEDERVVTVAMKGQHSDQILAEFLEKTGAVPVAPSAQEEIDMQEVDELRERGDADREVMRKYLTQQRREAALMAQARNEAAAMKAAI